MMLIFMIFLDSNWILMRVLLKLKGEKGQLLTPTLVMNFISYTSSWLNHNNLLQFWCPLVASLRMPSRFWDRRPTIKAYSRVESNSCSLSGCAIRIGEGPSVILKTSIFKNKELGRMGVGGGKALPSWFSRS